MIKFLYYSFMLRNISSFGILYASCPEGILTLESYSAFFILITTAIISFNPVLPLSSLFFFLFVYNYILKISYGMKFLKYNKLVGSLILLPADQVLIARNIIFSLNILSFVLLLYFIYTWYRGVSIHHSVPISKFIITSIFFFLSTMFIWLGCILFFCNWLPVTIIKIDPAFFYETRYFVTFFLILISILVKFLLKINILEGLLNLLKFFCVLHIVGQIKIFITYLKTCSLIYSSTEDPKTYLTNNFINFRVKFTREEITLYFEKKLKELNLTLEDISPDSLNNLLNLCSPEAIDAAVEYIKLNRDQYNKGGSFWWFFEKAQPLIDITVLTSQYILAFTAIIGAGSCIIGFIRFIVRRGR